MADPKFVIPARLPAAPEKYERINEQKFRRILELALRNVEPAGTSEEVIQSGVLPIRLNKRFIANPSGNTGYATGEIEFEDCAGMFMLKVAMDMQSFADYGQCWLRIYASEADRTADEDRLIDDPLTDGLRILLDVVFEDPDDLEFRLFTIDCEGIPAFNWDDPSLPKLYYRLDLPDVDLGLANQMSFTQAGDPVTALSTGYPFEYPGVQTYYYTQWNLRTTGTTTPARYTLGPIDHTDFAAFWTGYRSGPLDSTAFFSLLCMYMSDGVTFDKSLLYGGLARSSGTTVSPIIGWIDDLGVSHVLDTATDIELLINNYLGFTLQTRTVAGTVKAFLYTYPYTDPTDLTLQCEVAVPVDLLVAGHDEVGFYSFGGDVPSAPYAYGGLGTISIGFGTATVPPVTVDLGYLPIERDGGTLVPVEES